MQARQTDYDYKRWGGQEHLYIVHKDASVKLHENCGFTKQCHNGLHTCTLAAGKDMVGIDHGSPGHITVQGTNGRMTDFCPFSPKNDLSAHDFATGNYGSDKSINGRAGWCSYRGTDPDCHYMWAQVKIECCCSGTTCSC